MPKVTIIFALLLIALGLWGYFAASSAPAADSETEASSSEGGEDQATASKEKKTSPTALIPAGAGALLLLCGLIGLAGGKARMHAMHVAAMVGLLGAFAAAGRGLSKIGALLSGDPDLNRRAVYSTLAMAAICTVYTVLCVQSFIAARKAREAEAGEKGKPEKSPAADA